MKKSVGVALLFLLAILGCSRSKDYVTPSICPSASFSIISPLSHPSSVNLKTSNINFTAKFNETVKWTLTIVGRNSNATKTFTGNSSNVNILWYGNPDLSSFFTAETCDVKFQIACLEEIISSFSITNPSNFTNLPNSVLITDFDGNGVAPNWQFQGNTNGDITFAGVVTAPANPSASGGNYYKFEGDSINPSFYFGSTYSSNFSLPSNWTDPSKVYLNLFANSDGLKNSEIQVAMPGSGGVVFRKQLNWNGWQPISFSMSEIEIQQVSKINVIDIGVGSAPEKGKSSTVLLDFVLFTYGQPFYQ